MHHRKTYMYNNFQQSRVSRSVKTVHTNLCAKIFNLYKFAICNYNFEKLCTAPSRTFRTILRLIGLLDIKIPQKEIISTNDRQTDGRTDRRRVRQQYVVFLKKEKTTKNCYLHNY